MVSRSLWLVVVSMALASVPACSGKSNKRGDGVAGAMGGAGGSSTSGGKAGETQAAGAAGAPSDAAAGGAMTSGATLTNVTSVATTTTGGITQVTSAGGSGPTNIPSTWTCSSLGYDNGVCDCGCGAPDPDCSSHDDLEACESCNTSGSCNGGSCPGKIDPEDTTRCVAPPSEWTCSSLLYADQQVCHCGCGAFDPDCEDESVESCDICNIAGACAAGACPSAIDPEDNSRCAAPEGWTCFVRYYGDSACHCGCGILDSDCSSPSRDACDSCWVGCANEACPGPIDADDNSICTGVPSRWRCLERFFGDGSLCHCGCGAPDPDCEGSELEACDRCNLEGSCSAQPCPGTIDPEDTTRCFQPPAPEEWTCSPGRYADGLVCDCGCGVADLDCRNQDRESCEDCSSCTGSASCLRVDPNDTTRCLEAPPDWDCYDERYGDGYSCDCGCGALDLDCESQLLESCDWCPTYAGSCSSYYCESIDPEDNARCHGSAPSEWSCDPDYYGDEACDCGCGVRDIDCASADVAACEFCDSEGSCSEQACPGTILGGDNAVCSAG